MRDEIGGSPPPALPPLVKGLLPPPSSTDRSRGSSRSRGDLSNPSRPGWERSKDPLAWAELEDGNRPMLSRPEG
ncbi:hypothetical protein AG1IA_02179 [Rhizoctonia solani AG-1 IA]|uniref:Uncharacterized protein n=1 Tax=Thanatephorus cucumeris (strain AG1-IA) TaxID=983506 RepID=L8X0R3_THACA|nr:hypothetical protein AG1IA_02179 [Rhizoctonia solani AG-1 IA]